MTDVEVRLSVPRRIHRAPRELENYEWETLEAVADVLIPSFEDSPRGSDAPGYRDWVRRAIAARAEHFDLLIEALGSLAGTAVRQQELETMASGTPQRFAVLSSVVAGAYLMVPIVREQIGYPGQGGATPRVDEAAEQLEDGILDAVIARGSIYQSASGE